MNRSADKRDRENVVRRLRNRETKSEFRTAIKAFDAACAAGNKAEAGELKVASIVVDEGATIKRLRPAPQGRAYRVRKRSNHVTLTVDTINKESK